MEDSVQNSETNPGHLTEKPAFYYFPFFNRKQAAFVLMLIGLIFYCTSIYNEYALDDGIIIHQNNYVLKGVRGIGKLLSTDSYDSFYKRMHATDQLQGGRYRPLSAVTFALEQELIGPYRTGYYLKAEDSNKNGVLDDEPVLNPTAYEANSTNFSTNASCKYKVDVDFETNYEYNNFVDLNNDNKAQINECYNCWDLNRNFINEAEEDANADGIFNEVDCQVNGAMFRHFNNIWLYALACVVFYLLLSKYLLKNQQDLAFLAALIFLTHPMHSSVVANVKSRDEILSLLFISLTFIFSFRYLADKTIKSLVLSGIMYFLALLSKEYGILLLILIPVAVHVFGQEKITWKNLLFPGLLFIAFGLIMVFLDLRTLYFGLPPLLLFLAFGMAYGLITYFVSRKNMLNGGFNILMPLLFFSALVYMAFRLNAVNMAPGVPDTEILNNPYLLSNGAQQLASKTFILLKYLIIALFPHPLVSDYSYATNVYRNLNDWEFILSAIVHILLLITGIRLVIKRHVLGFAIITYFAFLLMVCNYIIDIGTTMSENLYFHASIGFAITMAWLILKGLNKLVKITFAVKRNLLFGSLLVLVFLYGCKTWERNWDWKNDVTLFLKDVKNAPHSVLVLGNAGARWIDLSDTKQITGVDYPGLNNVLNDYNGTLVITDEDLKACNCNSKRDAALYKGIGYLKHAVELHPRYVNGFLNLGLASFKLNKEIDAITYWKLAERLYPDNPYLNNYYSVYSGILKRKGLGAFNRGALDTAVTEFSKWRVILPKQPEAWYYLGKALAGLNKKTKAVECWQKAWELDPAYDKTGQLPPPDCE